MPNKLAISSLKGSCLCVVEGQHFQFATARLQHSRAQLEPRKLLKLFSSPLFLGFDKVQETAGCSYDTFTSAFTSSRFVAVVHYLLFFCWSCSCSTVNSAWGLLVFSSFSSWSRCLRSCFCNCVLVSAVCFSETEFLMARLLLTSVTSETMLLLLYL